MGSQTYKEMIACQRVSFAPPRHTFLFENLQVKRWGEHILVNQDLQIIFFLNLRKKGSISKKVHYTKSQYN